MEIFNEEMLARAGNRSHVRQLWGIGQPFDVTSSSAVEENGPKFCWWVQIWNNKRVWTDESLMLAISRAIVDTLADLSEIDRDCKPTGGQEVQVG